jgi:predicted nucleotidyltransferase
MNPVIQAIAAELRRELDALYGDRLVRVLLFGSQARDEAVSGSDIDVLVVLKPPVRPGPEIGHVGPITARLSLNHDVVISCTFVSAERYALEQTPLLVNARREGIRI